MRRRWQGLSTDFAFSVVLLYMSAVLGETTDISAVDLTILKNMSTTWTALTPLMVYRLQKMKCPGTLYGFACDTEGRITKIIFPNHGQGVNGSVLGLLEKMEALQELRLQNNSLNGGIPDSLMGLKNLTIVDLSFNNLLTPPSYISPSIIVFNVSHNSLSGPIPDLSKSFSLTYFNLSYNNISGPILLSSTSPPSPIRVIDIGYNALVGSISEEIIGLSSLTTLFLSRNLMQGPVPQAIANLSFLEELMLDGNFLNGTLPPFLQTQPSYRVFDASCNEFSEPLPDWCSFPPIGNGQCAQHLAWCWNVKGIPFTPSPQSSRPPSPTLSPQISNSPPPSSNRFNDTNPASGGQSGVWALPLIAVAVIACLLLSCIAYGLLLGIRRRRANAMERDGSAYGAWRSFLEARARSSSVDRMDLSPTLLKETAPFTREGIEMREMVDNSLNFDASEVMHEDLEDVSLIDSNRVRTTAGRYIRLTNIS